MHQTAADPAIPTVLYLNAVSALNYWENRDRKTKGFLDRALNDFKY